MTTLVQDLRHALRALAKSPGFAATAVFTLALGIAATTTIFTWFKASVLNPIPGAHDSRRVVSIYTMKQGNCCFGDPYPLYEYLRDHNELYSGLVGHELISLNVSQGGRPEVVMAGVVSANYFDMLGVKPRLGRVFAVNDPAQPGGNPVAVLGYGFWQRRFGSDPRVIGQSIHLNRQTFTVIGVTPPGFFGTYGGVQQSVFVPITMYGQLESSSDPRGVPASLLIMGRLKPGISLGRAQAEARVLGRQFAHLKPEEYKKWEVVVEPHELRGITPMIAEFVPILAAAAGLMLLIGCANVASLLLGRATSRSREVAIRIALGAGRARVLKQLLTENLVLALLGGIVGLLPIFWTSQSLMALLPPLGIPIRLDLSVDFTVLGFAILITAMTGVFSGLVPALHASACGPMSTLKSESSTIAGAMGKSRLRNLLVIGQIALSCVALIGSGLLFRSLAKALNKDVGFDTRKTLLASFDLQVAGYTEGRGLNFYSELAERARAIPGVEAASLSSYVPLSMKGGGNTHRVEVEGYTPAPDENMDSIADSAGPGYFSSLGVPVLAGREFSPQDGKNGPAAVIVNEAVATHFWPGQSALGKRVKVDQTWREVVGVVRNFSYMQVADGSRPLLFVPLLSAYRPRATVILRTTGNPNALLPALRDTVSKLDPDLPLDDVTSLSEQMRTSLFEMRAPAAMLGVFALLALLLASVGLYGVLAFAVGQRTHEIGIRLTLGATRARVLAMVIWQGLRLAMVGTAIGLAGSVALGRMLENLIYGITPTDPPTFIAVSALLIAVTLLACCIPALRATKVDPMVALRYE